MGRSDRGARASSRPSRAPGTRERAADAPVEFLAPRSELFDASSAQVDGRREHAAPAAFADLDERRERPRWTIVGAAVAVVALVGGAVVALAPWDDGRQGADRASAATTVAPTSTTVHAVTGGVPGASPGYGTAGAPGVAAVSTAELDSAVPTDGYLLDPALLSGSWRAVGGLSPAMPDPQDGAAGADGGDQVGERDVVARPHGGWVEVWATPGAARDVGSWFAVEFHNGAAPVALQDAARIDLGDGRIGLLTQTPDGVRSLQFESSYGTATLTWYGESERMVLDMARTLHFARGGRPRFADTSFHTDHTRQLSRAGTGEGLAATLFTSDVISAARYRRSGDEGTPATIDITTRIADPVLDQDLARFVIGAAHALDGDQTILPAGADAVLAGEVRYAAASAPQDLQVLQWTIGDRTVQLTTDLPLDELVTEFPLGFVGAGTVGAWARQQLGSVSDASVYRPLVDLGSGELADGTTWQMTVDPEHSWVNAFITAPDLGHGMVVQLDLAVRPCGTSAWRGTDTSPSLEPGVTVIVCVVPGSQWRQDLEVTGPWGSLDEPLDEAGGGAWRAVVAEFDGTGGFSAELVGANGTRTPGLRIDGMVAADGSALRSGGS